MPNAGDNLAGRLSAHAHWILRATLLAVLFSNGVLMDLGAGNVKTAFTSLSLWGVLSGLAVAGALLLLAGGFGYQRLGDLATRVGAALNIPALMGAVWAQRLHGLDILASDNRGMAGVEFQVTLIILLLFLVFNGNSGACRIGLVRYRTELCN